MLMNDARIVSEATETPEHIHNFKILETAMY